MSKRIGLPVTLKMRHDAHYVETLTSYSGASIGRMIPIDKIRPNPDQPRKFIGDVSELAASIREKGVLEPLLVRYVPREDTYYIISGERRYHASQAAGLHELPCIEKIADDAETLELALIENLQRKDLTPFEEADGLQRLADHFDYTHDDIAKKIGRARSSVTESMSLRVIPHDVRQAVRRKRNRLEIAAAASGAAAQRKEDAGNGAAHRQGGLTRDEARRARKEETEPAPRPQPFIFDYKARRRVVPPAHSIPQEPRERRGVGRGPARSVAPNRIGHRFGNDVHIGCSVTRSSGADCPGSSLFCLSSVSIRSLPKRHGLCCAALLRPGPLRFLAAVLKKAGGRAIISDCHHNSGRAPR